MNSHPCHRRTFLLTAAGAGLGPGVLARPRPTDRVVKILVGFPVAQATDTVARLLADKLAKSSRIGPAKAAASRWASSPGAANRDPRKWTDPDRYDITRNVSGVHRTCGVGTYMCIGQMIARLEAECLLGALARRVKRIELTGEPVRRLVNALRTLDSLPLRLILF